MLGFAAFLLASSAQAAPAPAPTAAAMVQQAEAAMRKQGFSEAGIKVLTRDDPSALATYQRIASEAEKLARDLLMAVQAHTPDPAAIGALLKKRDALNSQMAALRTDQMVETLTTLSPADRKLFLKASETQAKAAR